MRGINILVTALWIKAGVQLKGHRHTGDRRLIKQYPHKNGIGGAGALNGFNDGAIIVVLVHLICLSTDFSDLRSLAPIIPFLRRLERLSLGKIVDGQAEHVFPDLNVKWLCTGRTAIIANQSDVLRSAEVITASRATGQPRNAPHDDTLACLVAGVFQRQPGRCIGE